MADITSYNQFVLPGLNPELNGILPWDIFMEIMGIDIELFLQGKLTQDQIHDLQKLLNKFREINDIGVLSEYGIAALYRTILEMGRNTEINIMFRMHKEWRRMKYGVDYDIKKIKQSDRHTMADRKEHQMDIARVSTNAISAVDYNRGLSLLNDFIEEKYMDPSFPDTSSFALVLDLMNEINNILIENGDPKKKQVTLGRQLRFALANIVRQTYSPDFLESILKESSQEVREEQ
jgi:hypothetical protein